MTLAGGDAKRARVLFVCYYLKQQFPISFAEVLLCTYDPATKTPQYYNPLGRNLAFNTKLTKTYNVAANTPPLLGESAAMLLIALERGTGGAGKTADVFGASSIRPFAFPTNANPAGSVDVPVLKDDWNTPLAFFRWSTADADLDGTLPIGSRSRNNLDPENKLIDANWFNVVVNGKTVINPNRVLFERSCYSLSDAKGNPYVYYITPVIVSAGTNTKFGIDLQTMAVNNQDDANDNVYSYRLKRE